MLRVCPDPVTTQPAFLLAVSLGAALTVLLATWTGMPVSTTHALTGGLVGAGLLAASGEVQFTALGTSFVLPLLFGPVVSLLVTVAVYPCFRWARRTFGVTSRTCVCVGCTYEEVAVAPNGQLALARTGAVIEVGTVRQCVERYQGQMLGVQAGPGVTATLDHDQDDLGPVLTAAVGRASDLHVVAVLRELIRVGRPRRRKVSGRHPARDAHHQFAPQAPARSGNRVRR